MADLNRTRDPLEIAASSSDPKVRRLALEFKSAEATLARLKGFFELYDSAGISENDVPQPETKAKQPQAPARKRVQRKTSPGRSKSPAVSHAEACEAIRAILIQQGPLDRESLLARYHEAMPADGDRNAESLRVLLSKNQAIIGRVSETDNRYWPAGVPYHVAA